MANRLTRVNCFPGIGCTEIYEAILYNPSEIVLGSGSVASPFYVAAFGVDGSQQVGCANGRVAALWTGTAASLVSLHPTGVNAFESYALGVRAGHQVGYTTFSGNVDHACRWTGTAASFVDLHPAGALDSQAHQVDNGVQVGQAVFGSDLHAALWTGTAASFVDLHPNWANITDSCARGVSGGLQAGTVFLSNGVRATIWNGTASSAQDLHLFLPADFTGSWAEGIDVQGGTVTVVGYGYNTTTNREEALMWTASVSQINQPPTNVITCAGGTAVFSIGVTAGSSTPTYRWRRNAIDLADGGRISGSGTPTLTITSVNAGDVGSYDCIVSDAIVTLDSANATLALSQATPSVSPNGICPGGSASFSLNLSSPAAPTSYQWRRNGMPVNVGSNPSAATPVLSIASVVTADAGTYDCLITTSCGVIDSGDVNFRVGNVFQPPANQSGCTGGSATFTVVLDQNRPGQQWLKNGNTISGNATATTTTLVLNNLSAADAATYSFRYNANSGCGTVTTNGATLTVTSGGPVLTLQPLNTSVCVGSEWSFNVAATGASSYAWRKGAVPIYTITNPSAATASLMLTNIEPGDAGFYSCIITNACGSVTSNTSSLIVQDSCCDSIDFNDDGLFPDDADIVDFFRVFAGGGCSTGSCNDIDFNNDGLFPDDTDLITFLTVLAGGPC